MNDNASLYTYCMVYFDPCKAAGHATCAYAGSRIRYADSTLFTCIHLVECRFLGTGRAGYVSVHEGGVGKQEREVGETIRSSRVELT